MNPIITQEIAEHLWSRIEIGADDECWEWQGARQSDGYGTIWIGRKCYLAHRMAYLIHYGDLTSDGCILHRCDNPPCCNPSHLWEGTHADNMRDRSAKDRIDLKGENNPHNKLTDNDVVTIRRRYKQGGVFQKELAREFGVTQTLISYIVLGKAWKHLPLP